MLKMYHMSFGWAGSITVIAESEEEARKIMKGDEYYEDEIPVEVQDIVAGAYFSNCGDR